MHVIGPQLGLTQPGMTIVCGDSHTSTHGAFGALAFGIGTSEVEHVLATQTLPLRPLKTMAVTVEGELPAGVTAKDIVLALIAKIGTGGGQGHIIEYRGPAIAALSMEARMTVCNMSIEAGARAGHDRPGRDDVRLPQGPAARAEGRRLGRPRVDYWRTLRTDADATFDREVVLDAAALVAVRHLGDQPGAGRAARLRPVPDPASCRTRTQRAAAERALAYMGLAPGPRSATSPSTPCSSAPAPTGGSRTCAPPRTSSAAARSPTACGCSSCRARCWSRQQAEQEGLHEVFTAAGAEWRSAGCSMCLGMNPDTLAPGERCASTSNRNFEGRQGAGGRTHLVSPARRRRDRRHRAVHRPRRPGLTSANS